MSRHLILGGARSGKSRHAENLARASGLQVVVIATAQALDAEMQARIARHRSERPAGFLCVEEPLALAEALRRAAAPGRCLVVDCLTLWLTNLLLAEAALPEDGTTPHGLAEAVAALVEILPGLPGEVLLVANEVGFGLVPDNPLGRVFRDEAGRLNQRVAALCEAVTLVAAGLPLRLKGA